MYYVYILYSIDFDRYYVGQYKDVAIRLKRHNGKTVPSAKAYTPWKLVYNETFGSRGKRFIEKLKLKRRKAENISNILLVELIDRSRFNIGICSNTSILVSSR